jgi:hypothetical protein
MQQRVPFAREVDVGAVPVTVGDNVVQHPH